MILEMQMGLPADFQAGAREGERDREECSDFIKISFPAQGRMENSYSVSGRQFYLNHRIML